MQQQFHYQAHLQVLFFIFLLYNIWLAISSKSIKYAHDRKLNYGKICDLMVECSIYSKALVWTYRNRKILHEKNPRRIEKKILRFWHIMVKVYGNPSVMLVASMIMIMMTTTTMMVMERNYNIPNDKNNWLSYCNACSIYIRSLYS